MCCTVYFVLAIVLVLANSYTVFKNSKYKNNSEKKKKQYYYYRSALHVGVIIIISISRHFLVNFFGKFQKCCHARQN